MKKKHNEGFTLVELLVSIVILSAIVIPTCTGLVLSYRINAKAKDMMQAQLAVSSTVETLMAQGIDAARVAALQENAIFTDEPIFYDFAIVDGQVSQTDDYPGVQIAITGDDTADGYVTLTISDDRGLVSVNTQVRLKTGGGSQ